VKRRRNLLRTYMHFIWTTHDRLPLVTEEIERQVYRYIVAVCEDMKCNVLAIGGMPDHVHLFILLPTTVTLAEIMKNTKAGSSRFVSEDLKSGEWFAWHKNYGAYAVIPSHKKRVIAYVLNQKQHHADGTLIASLEEDGEEYESEDE
jgi:putative transposase